MVLWTANTERYSSVRKYHWFLYVMHAKVANPMASHVNCMQCMSG